MKPLKYFVLIFISFFLSCDNDDDNSSARLTKVEQAQQLLNSATTNFPGLSLTIKGPQGTNTLVAGKAKLPDTAMQATSLHYMHSISKTFTAVAVLKLHEQAVLDINKPISDYLPVSVCNQLPNGNTCTVKQLLNMTSGIPDYLDNPSFIEDIQTASLPMPSSQILSYVYSRPADFAPGTQMKYSNTNYHLLALILDNQLPEGHANFIKTIFTNAGLTNTYYLPGSSLTSAPQGITASYLPDGNNFTDISPLQFGIVKSLIGDDGIVSSTQDIAAFYVKLLKDKTIISQESLQIMATPGIAATPYYGMGLAFYTSPSGISGLGHPGSGPGAAAEAAYFPDKNISLVLTANAGTLLDAEKEDQFNTLWRKLLTIFVDK